MNSATNHTSYCKQLWGMTLLVHAHESYSIVSLFVCYHSSTSLWGATNWTPPAKSVLHSKGFQQTDSPKDISFPNYILFFILVQLNSRLFAVSSTIHLSYYRISTEYAACASARCHSIIKQDHLTTFTYVFRTGINRSSDVKVAITPWKSARSVRQEVNVESSVQCLTPDSLSLKRKQWTDEHLMVAAMKAGEDGGAS